MLKLNTDEVRNLQFEVSIQGINHDELQGSLRFIIDEIEYGFPVKVGRESVTVEVPPLEEIVAQGMKDGDIVECKLDIFGNGFYLNPWGGEFELKTPVKMEAKMTYDDSLVLENSRKSRKPVEKKITATLKESDPEPVLEDEDIIPDSNEARNSLLEMKFKQAENNVFKTRPTKKATPRKATPKENLSERKEAVTNKVQNKMNQMTELLERLTSGKKVIREARPAPVRKPTTTRKTKKTEVPIKHTPHSLMESVGMRSEKMQNMMIEKAIEKGGDGDEAIVETLKKMLGVEQPTDLMEQYNKVNKLGNL